MIFVQLEPVESHMFCLFGHLRLPQPQVKWAKRERNFWNSADIHMVKHGETRNGGRLGKHIGFKIENDKFWMMLESPHS